MQKHFIYEKNLQFQGYKLIAGLDEAGRGSWAGPIVAAAIIFDLEKQIPKDIKKFIRDSKLLTIKKREEIYDWLIGNCLDYAIGEVSHLEIDQIGLGKANKLVMKKAVENLKDIPEYLLIDCLKLKEVKLPQQSIINGDNLVTSISAASIIAKVYRDNLMNSYAAEFPQYGFERHKGYGTKFHQEMLCNHGVCGIHRRSFRPIKNILNSS